ncbi:fungal-specific transcription factor domain-containing protein [Triangularia verruculosa]|uniref:Fungal-specific transcription factor domain-containing protein n=1 Tax=Triangularia verruculosa TaxID=2587418 RepID=A0AAN6XQM1_9PEZI|nr:fungal-specific transcription factor domain-containing protein [Triangularia verruculosa]
MEAMLESGGHVLPRTPSVTSSTVLDPAAQPKSVKRPRPVKSCVECRKRKLKCDRITPCSQCQKSRRPCRYTDQENGIGSDGSDGESAERPVKRPQHLANIIDGDHSRPFSQSNGMEHNHKPQVGLDEMASRLERLERIITEKTSPTFPYRHSTAIRSRPFNPGFRVPTTQGWDSMQALLNIFDEADDLLRTMARTDHLRGPFARLQSACRILKKEHHKALEPIAVYVDSMMPIQKRMTDVLPPRSVCDRLVNRYFIVSEGLYRMVHIPSFHHEYSQYWDKRGCSESFLPRLLCMMSIAARFGTDARSLGQEKFTSINTPTACTLVRHWLDDLRRKQVTDITALQTELLLLHAQRTICPYQRGPWTQLGYILRMAITMDLHRDPSELPFMDPFTSEIRRRLWYTLLEMDLHMSLSCHLPFAIRTGEYTCKPPSNLDDSSLSPTVPSLPPSLPLDHPTANRLQAYTSRTLQTRIEAAALISHYQALDSYQPILSAGQQLENLLSDVTALFPRHASLSPENTHKEWRHRALLDMHVRRPLLALYRPFTLGHLSDPSSCPPSIELSYLKSAMAILTYADELDTRSPGYEEVVAMYLLAMKKDIVEAGLGVCTYIKRAQQQQRNNSQVSQNSDSEPWYGHPPQPPHHYHYHHHRHSQSNSHNPYEEDFLSAVPGQRGAHYPWSAVTMAQTVERALERLITLIPDSSSDVNEIVALGVVLSSVWPGTIDEKLQTMQRIIGRVQEVVSGALTQMGSSAGAIQPPQQPPPGYAKLGTAGPLTNGYMSDGPSSDNGVFNWENFLERWDAAASSPSIPTRTQPPPPAQHQQQHREYAAGSGLRN